MKNNTKSSAFEAVISFVKKNVMGVSILAASLLVMGIANAFFLPYVFTAMINNTGVAWYEYLIGSVLFCIAVAGLVWAITILCYRSGNKGKGVGDAVKYFGGILLTLLVIFVISTIYSFIIGQLGVTWYYLLKDIVGAKIAIDITARAFSVPLNALILCILGNVLMKKRPVYKLTTGRYFRLFAVAAVYAAVEYLMTIPAINSTWLLVLTCVLNAAMYTLIIVIALVLCKREDSSDDGHEALYEEHENELSIEYEEDGQMQPYDESESENDELGDGFEELMPADDQGMNDMLAKIDEEFAEVEAISEDRGFGFEETFDEFDKGSDIPDEFNDDLDGGIDDEK